jgi:hypothetical protein
MKQSYLVVVKPTQMNDKQKEDLVYLHQKRITLDHEQILHHLQNRDYIYLYYHKKNNQLIATAGIQLLQFPSTLFIYIGNTVVDEKFKHEGCLSHVILKSMLFTLIQHPFKKKYWCALASSSGSFSYAQRFQPCWPNPNESTPQHITDIMQECIKKIGINEFKVINGHVITYDLCNKINKTLYVPTNNEHSNTQSFFHKINPEADNGEQLFFINSFRIYKLINAGIYSFHHKLIKQPKIYHRLKRIRFHSPLLSTFLILNNLVSKKAKVLIGLVAVFVVAWVSM